MRQIRNFLWYLPQPIYWPHLWHLILKRVRRNLDTPQYRRLAANWAHSRAKPVPQVLFELGLTSSAMAEIPRMPAGVIEEAKKLAAKSGYEMGGPGDVNLLYAATFLSSARAAVETGVAYGWSSLAILRAMERLGGGHLASVDMPYPRAGNEPFVGIVVPQELRKSWTLVREPDRNGLRKALAHFSQGVDLVHYDSDKSYHGRMYAYPLLWQSLRPGGVFISDDIQDNLAFSEFVEKLGVKFSVTEALGKYVGIAVKPQLETTRVPSEDGSIK